MTSELLKIDSIRCSAKLTSTSRTDKLSSQDAQSGTLIGGGGLHATTRDWARIGLLIQNYWVGAGGDCLSNYLKKGYQSKDRNGYGYHIWIQKESGDRKIVRMAGALGQSIYFNNFNRKLLVTFSNNASRKLTEQFVESWMLN